MTPKKKRFNNWCHKDTDFYFIKEDIKMKKGKLLTLLPLFAMLMTSCGAQKDWMIKYDPDKVYNIGICQLVQHDALDAATNGFMKAVEEGLGKDKVKFDLQNAAGSSDLCVTISNKFVSNKVDLIMANATPALQAAANSTLSIPVLGTSITEYGVALNLKDFKGTVGGNVSGTSDLAPLDGQADMFSELLPNAKSVGLLYCSAEANSIYQVNTVKSFLEKKGLTTKMISFADSNELQTVLSGSVAGLDALYIPTDNVCADNTPVIDAICSQNNLPVICGEENLCKGCGIASLSIDYFNLGMKTGQMALEIIKNGKDISKMPIAYDESPVKKFNAEKCTALGITVPSSYVAIA